MRLLTRIFPARPVFTGFEEILWLICGTTLCAGFSFQFLALPSPDLMRDIANVGIVLVLAYVVEVAWLTSKMVSDGLPRAAVELREPSIGYFLGAGMAGFAGVVVAVLVSAHRAAGHGNWLDDLGLAWSVVSLLILGIMVLLHPWLVYVWEMPKGEDPS